MIRRILGRTLIIFCTVIGFLLLIFIGIISLVVGCVQGAFGEGPGWIAIVIAVLCFGGALFLRIFADELRRRVEIWTD